MGDAYGGAIVPIREEQTELISALVEGAFESPLWVTFLNRLRRATSADYATLGFGGPGRPYLLEELLDPPGTPQSGLGGL